MTPIDSARLRLRLAAGPLGTDPAQLADQATTLADCRIAYNVARGYDPNALCPTTGRTPEEMQ